MKTAHYTDKENNTVLVTVLIEGNKRSYVKFPSGKGQYVSNKNLT